MRKLGVVIARILALTIVAPPASTKSQAKPNCI